jgi:hypothetical protein
MRIDCGVPETGVASGHSYEIANVNESMAIGVD